MNDDGSSHFLLAGHLIIRRRIQINGNSENVLSINPYSPNIDQRTKTKKNVYKYCTSDRIQQRGN